MVFLRPSSRPSLPRLALQFALLLPAGAVALLGLPRAGAQASVEPAGVIPQGNLLQPAQLEAMLRQGKKLTVLQVGSHTLFAEAHIPGSDYAGAGSTPAGLASLRERVKLLSKNSPVVLYCGCCPWGRCPNIRPAYRELHALGFTNLKVLYLAQDFGADWEQKGYPVQKGD